MRSFKYLHELENLYFSFHHCEITQQIALLNGRSESKKPLLISELRQGNKIVGKRISDHSDAIITVLELRQSSVIYSGFKKVYSDKGIEIIPGIDPFDPILSGWLKPLPISHDWLIDLGFDPVNKEKNVYQRGHLSVSILGSQATLREGSHHFGRAFQFVHQLQNLYYVVTGAELIKTENKLIYDNY